MRIIQRYILQSFSFETRQYDTKRFQIFELNSKLSSRLFVLYIFLNYSNFQKPPHLLMCPLRLCAHVNDANNGQNGQIYRLNSLKIPMTCPSLILSYKTRIKKILNCQKIRNNAFKITVYCTYDLFIILNILYYC